MSTLIIFALSEDLIYEQPLIRVIFVMVTPWRLELPVLSLTALQVSLVIVSLPDSVEVDQILGRQFVELGFCFVFSADRLPAKKCQRELASNGGEKNTYLAHGRTHGIMAWVCRHCTMVKLQWFVMSLSPVWGYFLQILYRNGLKF